jgi:hypothetical protein
MILQQRMLLQIQLLRNFPATALYESALTGQWPADKLRSLG